MSPATFLGIPRRNTADPDGSPIRGEQPFPKAARKELANAQLRRNLAHATSTIRAKRALVVDEMPDWEALRDAGSAIKTDVMARLPELLEQLEANITARGGVVHWATDAQEANQIVTDLVRATGATEVVKVKSMATQEIGLNEYLEEHEIAAVETDLAELIVQLAHDKPSHILVPAIHRNRTEVRDIFLAEMADAPADLTDEPRRLAMAAREHLRRKFLTATVAISGANFGIADTGTLCVVESEGNGRMCLTLPQTLITVMGIEKLLPTFTDLEVFLQLLPRSSTGERMNPYTSLWTGVTPGDGPQEFHLILLDNGRTNALADKVGRAALHCIRCSACLNVCPVYTRTGGHAYGSVYPGPIGAILTPMLTGIAGHGDPNSSLPYASSLCGACYDVCPVKIDIPTILVELRAQVVDADRHRMIPGGWDAALRAASWVMSDEKRFAVAEKGLAAGATRRWAQGPDPAPPATAVRVDRQPGPARPTRPNLPELVEGQPPGPRYRRRVRNWGGETMTTSRDTVMGKIRAALADDGSPIPIPRDYIRRGQHDPGSGPVIELLVDRLVDYRALVHRVTADGLPAALDEALSGMTQVVIGTGLDPAIAAACAGSGRTVTTDSAPASPFTPGTRRHRRGGDHCPGGHRDVRHHRSGRRGRPGPPRHHPRAGPAHHHPDRRPDRRNRRRGHLAAEPDRPAHHDRRPVRHQRHRTRTCRRGPRTPHPARDHHQRLS